MQISVMKKLVDVNKLENDAARVPVWEKKSANTPDCNKIVTPVISKIQTVSISLSVTTVPNDFVKDTPSYFDRIPQRETSPMRGTTKFAAYDTKTAYTQLDDLGNSSSGSSANFQRHPRNRCPNTPKTNEKAIHPTFISVSADETH